DRATYVATLENGRHLYGWQGVAFVYDPADDAIVTVFKHTNTPRTMHAKIADLLRSELEKIANRRNQTEKRIERTKRELEIERSYCVVAMYESRSPAVKLAQKARIAAIDEYIGQLDGELAEISAEYSSVAKGIVSYV
ncbi:MAG TPA: hypothetical protein VFK27_04860, partial [Bacillales bacterium]|nr:hypothetical protein [Bacillales bacterium]